MINPKYCFSKMKISQYFPDIPFSALVDLYSGEYTEKKQKYFNQEHKKILSSINYDDFISETYADSMIIC